MAAYFYYAKDTIGPIQANTNRKLFAVGGGGVASKKRNVYTIYGEVVAVFDWDANKLNNGQLTFTIHFTGITLGGKEETYSYGHNGKNGSKQGNNLVCCIYFIPGTTTGFILGTGRSYRDKFGFGGAAGWGERSYALGPRYLQGNIFTKLWVWASAGPTEVKSLTYNLAIVRFT
jgi:hypothetical protein